MFVIIKDILVPRVRFDRNEKLWSWLQHSSVSTYCAVGRVDFQSGQSRQLHVLKLWENDRICGMLSLDVKMRRLFFLAGWTAISWIVRIGELVLLPLVVLLDEIGTRGRATLHCATLQNMIRWQHATNLMPRVCLFYWMRGSRCLLIRKALDDAGQWISLIGSGCWVFFLSLKSQQRCQ